ncbi:endo-1,4-beta-xylanase [Segatella copri]|uniref:endo-1,4-beta-xylanase n=1 Tax=Segatella copri TaxID=165179 RepID=UPI002232917D|nr:endo-1,4-beta-xylanase [Segatella copri]MCW4085271.1 endo-1,4-beta-xylanase [Segatella copri]MCW4160149.1 endo-1,4-beta-xylanase [Segatella copri]
MKKIHNILLASAAATLLLTGCVEDFDTSYAAGEKPENVAMDDLTRGYEVLKNYTGMKLGANLTIADLKAANTSFSTVLANFNEVNIADGFSHAAVVADDGTVSADASKDAVDAAIAAGLAPTASLFAPNAWNMTVMKEATKDTWVDGENVDLHQKYDFESSAIGDVFGTDKDSKVAKDPKGKNGKSLCIKKAAKFIEFPVNLPEGASLSTIKTISFDYYSSNVKKDVVIRVKVGDKTLQLRNFGIPTKAKTWETFKVDLSKVNLTETFDADALKSSNITLVIGQAAVPQQVYVDNIDVYSPYQKPGHFDPRPADEKAADVKKAMFAYVDSVMQNYGDKVQAWNVASNLIEDLFYTLKSSENMVADGEFYPNDYMDENWVADVCKEIHSKKADAKLFYSEENLLANAEKTEAAINYINQWNEAGAKIEGIDAKLDVPYNSSSLAETKANIDILLAKLKASGLQVRLSDMNVYLADAGGTVADQSKATFEDYKGMAELYAYILNKAQDVLGDKLYGVSFSTINQGATGVGLWNHFNRLPTYVGVVNGLQKTEIKW